MKKILALFIVCLSLVVVGCSGDEKKEKATGSPTPTPTPTKTP